METQNCFRFFIEYHKQPDIVLFMNKFIVECFKERADLFFVFTYILANAPHLDTLSSICEKFDFTKLFEIHFKLRV